MDITGKSWREVNRQFRDSVRDKVRRAQSKAESCTVRASNELRNAELNVLRGKRNGRIYRVPYSSVKYRASASGEPPAVRTGTLRNSWGIIAMGSSAIGKYTAGIETNVPYAERLENGTSRMAARPFRERIIQRASPRIGDIFRSAGFK